MVSSVIDESEEVALRTHYPQQASQVDFVPSAPPLAGGGDDVETHIIPEDSAGPVAPVRPWYIFFVATAAALTAATLGYDVGVMAAALDRMGSFHMSSFEKEVLVSSLNFVAAVGALIAGATADFLGRRRTVAVCSFLYLVGTALMTVAVTYGMLLGGRVITGLGVGISFVVGPTYISEIAPHTIRGKLATIFDVSINAGILFGYVVGYAVQNLFGSYSDDVRWRIMIGAGGVFPVLVAIFLVWLPESPRWLLRQGREAEAVTVLEKVIPLHEVAPAVRDICAEESAQAGWCETLWPRESYLRTALGIAFGLAFWQQITGSEAVLYYSPTFLKNAGLTSEGMLLLGNILVGSAKLLPEFWVMASIDKKGRRWHLLLSATTMTVAIAALAAAFLFKFPPGVAVGLLCAFMATFSAGLGPFSFIAASEIIPLSHRAKGMALVTFINRLTSGAVALTALSLSDKIGEGYYFVIYAGISLVSVKFYYSRVHETAGKTLEQITEELKQPPHMSLPRAFCLF